MNDLITYRDYIPPLRRYDIFISSFSDKYFSYVLHNVLNSDLKAIRLCATGLWPYNGYNGFTASQSILHYLIKHKCPGWEKSNLSYVRYNYPFFKRTKKLG